MKKSSMERLLAKINKTETCWLWTGGISKKSGYGSFWLGGPGYAHRGSYILHKGPIPEGLVIDHLCRVRHCVNPDHLEAVTQKVNTDRGIMREAVAASNTRRGLERTHCVNKHEFTPENTKMESKGNGRFARRCTRCQKDRYAAKKLNLTSA
jgi:hypothetical protein